MKFDELCESVLSEQTPIPTDEEHKIINAFTFIKNGFRAAPSSMSPVIIVFKGKEKIAAIEWNKSTNGPNMEIRSKKHKNKLKKIITKLYGDNVRIGAPVAQT